MSKSVTHVGLDAHARTIQVAMLIAGASKPVEWSVSNDQASVKCLAKKLLESASGDVSCCYEAGPVGYALQRQLAAAKVPCTVIAPSLIPFKPGERIKADSR